MTNIGIIEIIGTLLAVCMVLIGPTVWFYRHNTSRLENENQKIVTEVKESNKDQFNDLKSDLREFRTHFDSKISEVYVALDSKNRELKDFLLKEIDYVRNGIEKVDNSVLMTNNRSHELEKDILRLQNTLVQEYVAKKDIHMYTRKSD